MNFADFRRMCGQWWSTTIMQTRLSRVGTGISTLDTVTMSDGDGVNPGAEIDLTRLEQFGDVVIPPNDLNAAILRKSDGGYVMSLGQPSMRPTDGKQGDRGLYCSTAGTRIHLYGPASAQPGAIVITQQSGARVTIDKDGQVLIDAASGKDVVVNGGSKPVARVDDTVDWGSCVATVSAGVVTFIYTGPDGIPVTSTTLLPRPLIDGGAPRFKA